MLNMSQQYKVMPKKANENLRCINRRIMSRSREVMVPLYSALVRAYLEQCVMFGWPLIRMDISKLKCIQRRATIWRPNPMRNG